MHPPVGRSKDAGAAAHEVAQERFVLGTTSRKEPIALHVHAVEGVGGGAQADGINVLDTEASVIEGLLNRHRRQLNPSLF